MQKLSFLILFFLSILNFAQSPHGKNFNVDCIECHNTDNWKIDYNTLEFDHSITGFYLSGQHNMLDCQNCHTSIVFSDVKNQCYSCHTDIHQNSVDQNCENCHTSDSWLVKDITNIHRLGRFPLVGKHRLANCQDCHISSSNLNFEPLGIECIDCHLTDYQSAKQPDHLTAGFSTECFECHQLSDNTWNKTNINHNFFPLVGGHQIGNCFDCHNESTYEGLDTYCFTCHESDYLTTSDPDHQNSNFSDDCSICHTINPDWKPAAFKEHDNFFQLVGAHKEIENDCAKCHSSGYSNTPNLCYDCHKSNYDNTSNPAHSSAGFGTDCESCHNADAWEPADFDHDDQFFPIYTGEHRGEWNECSDCHTNSADYQIFECITCHEHNENEMNGEHSGVNGYVYESISCFACHPSGSSDGGFNHSSTEFPLTGAHISTSCQDCHTSGYQGTSTQCNNCHQNDFQNSVNPNHQQLGLELNCEQCHTTNPNWEPASFSIHNEFYVIEGAHIENFNDCGSCHLGDYNNTKNLCSDCHINEYNNTADPDHQSAGFSIECESCHTQNAWQPAEFDHDNQFFPIYSGSHMNQWNECGDCHLISTNYQQFECTICHEHDQPQMDESHQGVQGYVYLSTECYACHPTGNEEGSFNHSLSAFPLTGAHISQDCADCHENGYANTSSECFQCHQNNYNSAANPKHIEAGISILCENCHNTAVWKPSDFEHTSTGFELLGGHSTPVCSDCHTINTANATPDCFSCHESDYNIAPDHKNQNYPTECDDCHSINNWEETDFNHSNTQFALTGAHLNTSCNLCHQSSFAGTSTICSECHDSDYEESLNPSHVNLDLSTDCISCHTTNPAWRPAEFPVHNDFYVLQGAHLTISNECASCHLGDYNSGKDMCFDCHSNDYQETINPPHTGSGFGTDCDVCHNQTAWTPSTFDHDNQFFPIYSGRHREQWNQCSDCHTIQSDYSVFSCIDCHEHNQTSMDEKHKEERDYVYDSNACLECHPDGSEKNLMHMIRYKTRKIR